MTKIKMLFISTAIVLLFCTAGFAQIKCMYVKDATGAADLARLDSFMVAHLKSWGYEVEEHLGPDLVNYTAADYEDYDFIFVSESIVSGHAAPLKEVPKPILNTEGWSPKFSSLRWAAEPNADHIWMELAKPVKFLAAGAGHPLAAGYTAGTVVSLCDTSDLIVASKPDIPVIPIAALESDPSWLVAYGVEKGTALYDTTLVTQNRVALVGVHAWAFETLTDASLRLIKAGIDWILAEPEPIAKCMYVKDATGAADLAKLDSFMVAHLKTWGYEVEEHLGPDLVNYTAADYEDYDFIFVSESIVSGHAAPLKEVPKPILNTEGWSPKYSSLRWAAEPNADHIWMELAKPVKFLAAGAGHPLAAGYTAGTVVSLCDTSDLIVASKPDIPVIPIAALESDPSWLVAYGVEKGTALYDTTLVTQNRVALVGVHAWAFETLTDASVRLIKAGIDWILAEPEPAKKCMYVKDATGAADLAKLDSFMVAHLKTWGYAVEEHLGPDLVNYTAADYEDYDFVFISESIVSGHAAPLKDIPIPILNTEGWAPKYSSLRWAAEPNADHIWMELAKPVKFLAAGAGHPLAAGYAPGTVVSLCDTSDLIVASKPDIPVIPIAALESDTTWLVAYGVEKGTTLYDTTLVTKNRIALVGVHAWAFETLTDASVRLIKAGIEWILAETGPTGVSDNNVTPLPARFSLDQNYPNPFNPTTKIKYSIMKDSNVNLSVFNLLGQKVATLVDTKQNAGSYSVVFDAAGLGSGVYFYKLQTDGQAITQKMILTK